MSDGASRDRLYTREEYVALAAELAAERERTERQKAHIKLLEQRASNRKAEIVAKRKRFSKIAGSKNHYIAELEESKAALAAALVDLQDAANKLLDLRDGNPRSFTTRVELAWDELRGILIDLTSGAVRSLEYRDKAQRRKGAAWALRRIISQFATEHDRPWFEKMLSAIERGEVEVGG